MTTFKTTDFISDTHGFLATWTEHLQRRGLIDADWNWVGGPDRQLIHLGDHTDRGEDSVALYRHIKRLQQELAPGQVIRLVGNHDLQYLGGPECGWEDRIGRELSQEMYDDVLAGTLKFAHEFVAHDGSWLCVHAGLDAVWTEYHDMTIAEAVEAINKAGVEYVERNGRSIKHRIIDGIGVSRGGGRQWGPQGITWTDFWMDLRPNERWIKHRQIVGHTIQPNGAALSPGGKLWGINAHYAHAQSLVFDHETGVFAPSDLLAPEFSPFLTHVTVPVVHYSLVDEEEAPAPTNALPDPDDPIWSAFIV